MGLQWEREERRSIFDAKVQAAFFEAISDATGEFDEPDVKVWRTELQKWLDTDMPTPTVDKSGTPIIETDHK